MFLLITLCHNLKLAHTLNTADKGSVKNIYPLKGKFPFLLSKIKPQKGEEREKEKEKGERNEKTTGEKYLAFSLPVGILSIQ